MYLRRCYRRKDGKRHGYWALDRGMVSEENLRFLKEAKRRYIVGTPKGMLKRFAPELRSRDWKQVREGLEVRGCPAPGGQEIFLLCRSTQRKEKEQARHERFEKRIEKDLEKIARGCERRRQDPVRVGRRIGALLAGNFTGNRTVHFVCQPVFTSYRFYL